MDLHYAARFRSCLGLTLEDQREGGVSERYRCTSRLMVESFSLGRVSGASVGYSNSLALREITKCVQPFYDDYAEIYMLITIEKPEDCIYYKAELVWNSGGISFRKIPVLVLGFRVVKDY